MTVIKRSGIKVTPHKYGYQYEFSIELENGDKHTFENFAHTRDKAMSAGIRRSQRLIERGYPEGLEGGRAVETFGSGK